ncbi:MAG: 30S ribosomal protein THX [Bacteroidota bacterium]|nr:30S ribosomal protein THX [Bacteroidota bacterium]
MGKGDRKTKKGKIRIGSYGKLRPRKKTIESFVVKKTEEKVEEVAKKPAKKKTTTKKKTATKKSTKKKA